MNRNRFLFPVLLVFFWLVTLFIINPTGNFPLNDDWVYSRVVSFMVNKGYYYSPDAYTSIFSAQVIWGSLFCLPLGFSFTALRISTLVLSLLGIMGLYSLLLKASKNYQLSFLGALLLAANPMYVALSNTFMTDVPFLVFAMFSIYFFLLYMESNSPVHIIIATVFAIIATLIRQFGLIIPVAFAFASIIKERPKFIQWMKYLLPVFATIVALELTLLWLKHIGSELPGSQLIKYLKQPNNLVDYSLKRSSLILAYSGFFLLPLLLYATWNNAFRITKHGRIIILIGIGICIPLLVFECRKLPDGNILDTYGIGPRTLKGMIEDFGNPNPNFSAKLLLLLQSVAFLGAVMLLINFLKMIMDVFQSYRTKKFTKSLFQQIFIISTFIGYALLIFIPVTFFDRYLLLFFPLSTLLILYRLNESAKIKLPIYITYCFMAAAMLFFSSALTHDYFAWNRSRWQGIDYLTKNLKISPHKIDGGYEFNCWMNIGKYFPSVHETNYSFVDDDEYIVAFHNFPGYTIIKEYPYQNYVPFEIKSIYILHRN